MALCETLQAESMQQPGDRRPHRSHGAGTMVSVVSLDRG